VLAVAINTPPTRGTVRVRSTPPGLEDRPITASAKRRGVAFADGDPKIREVYEYLVESINRVENQLNVRIDEVAVTSAKRVDELVTSCAKRTEVVDRFSEVQQSIDQLRGGAKTDLEERLAQADKNISDVLCRQQEALQSLAAAEAVIKNVTENNFMAMHDAVQKEVNILKDK
jgi:flagellar hook-basal body complex protein FliE